MSNYSTKTVTNHEKTKFIFGIKLVKKHVQFLGTKSRVDQGYFYLIINICFDSYHIYQPLC